MPFTPTEVAKAGKSSLDYFLKNKPIDQIGQEKPLLAALQKGKKSFGGAKEHIVEQIRTGYGSNAVWFTGSGDGQIAYNSRDTLAQARYTWYQVHDGMQISEDELIQNGLEVGENVKPKSASDAEVIQLTNIWEERCEALHLGLQEHFDHVLHLNGAGNANQLIGLDGLLGLTNATGVVGGIDRATAKYWRHYVDLTLTQATMFAKMEKAWKECYRKGGGRPDLILCGQTFYDTYAAACTTASATGGIQRTMVAGKGGTDMDASIGRLYYKGVEVQWDPTMDDNVGGLDTTATLWTKRCYFINTKHIKLRPISGNDFQTREPPRDKTAYALYIALVWRGALSMNQSNAHAVLALA